MDEGARILLTGFEPWGEHASNPAQALAERFDERSYGSLRVMGRVLPVALAPARALLCDLLQAAAPAAILHLGLAAGRRAVTVERWAHNWAEFAEPDTSGEQPRRAALHAAAPWVRPVTLDVERAVAAIQAVGVPANASASAGSYLCNAVLYASLGWAAARRFRGPLGFVHLPGEATLPLDEQARAIDAVLRLVAQPAAPADASVGRRPLRPPAPPLAV